MAEKVIYEYNLPDGTILELEGEVGQEAKADAEAKRIIATEFTQQPTPQQTQQTQQPSNFLEEFGNFQRDLAMSSAKGGVRGLATLAALPSMVTQGTTALMEYLGAPKPDPRISFVNPMLPGMSFKPTLPQVMEAIETIPGAEAVTQYQPQTKAGEYFESIGEFVAPGIPFAKPLTSQDRLKRFSNVLFPGIAAGTTSELTEDLPPYVSIPATIAAGGVTAAVTRPDKAANIAEAALRNVTDEELELAKQIQKIAREEFDIPVTATELIDNGLVNKLGEIVYKSERGGPIMYNFLKDRPDQVEFIAKQLTDKLIEEPKLLNEAIQGIKITAQKALKDAKKERKRRAEEAGYKVANTEALEPDQVLPLIRYIDDTVKRLDAGDPAIQTLNSLKRSLIKSKTSKKDQPQILDELGQPIRGQQPEIIITPQTNINTLDNILKRINSRISDSRVNKTRDRDIIDRNTERILREGLDEGGEGILTLLDRQLRTNKNYSAAKDEFAKLSEELVAPIERNLKPLLEGGISQGKIRSIIFDTGTRNVGDIKRTAEILNKVDPEAFQLIARTYFKNAINRTLNSQKAGDLKIAKGFDLKKQLTEMGREDNFLAMLEGVAKSKGVNPKEFVKGFENFNKVLSKTANIIGVNNPASPPPIKLISRDFAQFGAFMWQVKFAGKLEKFTKEKTLEKLADIFIQDDSIDQLVALAKTNPDSVKAVNLVRRILYVTNNIENDQQLEQSIQTQERLEQPVQ